MKKLLRAGAAAAATGFVLLTTAGAASAAVIAYEWTEGGPGNGTNSAHVSHHSVGGPVLADDFIAAVSGKVVQVDWWGSGQVTGFPDPDFFEMLFHGDAGGVPAATLPNGGLVEHTFTVPGTDADGDGVFAYSVQWTPQDMVLTAGSRYWLSMANGGAGWTWANAGGAGPTVGGQTFTGVASTGVGPNGGPHFGPWVPVSTATGAQQDFAFRVWVDVPLPGALPLLAAALGGLGLLGRRRRA